MSGALSSLLDYSDSDSDRQVDTNKSQEALGQAQGADGQTPKRQAPAHLQRSKRKLPPLHADGLHHKDSQDEATSVTDGTSSAKRARGDWLCYCFVEVPLNNIMNTLLQESHDYLQQHLGTEHTLIDLRSTDSTKKNAGDTTRDVTPADRSEDAARHLHISLTRPFTLRSYERDDYVQIATAELQRLRVLIKSFPLSFSRIAHLANDDASRHFMVLEVGSGRDKFEKLSSALSTELRRAFRAKSYYEEARFHASSAYVLTRSSAGHMKSASEEEQLSKRFDEIVKEVDARWGPTLRKCPAIWASRIGIQVANRVTFVDL